MTPNTPTASPTTDSSESASFIDVRDEASRLIAAADSLEQWATRWKVADDPYVSGMTEALRARQNLTAWARHDPLDRLPLPDQADGGYRESGDLLANIRNVLVFVPVAITWWGVYEATSAFKSIRGTGPGLTFLDVWVTGADQPGALWTISNIALFDALLIVVIVVLTIASTWRDARLARQVVQSEKDARSERAKTGLALATALHGHKESTPDSIAETVASVLTDLSAAGRQVIDASTRLSDAATSASSELDSSASRLEQTTRLATDGLGDTVDKLHTASGGVAQLTARLDTLQQHLEDLLARGASSIGGPLQETSAAIDDLRQAVSQLTSWAKSDPQDKVNEFTTSLNDIAQQINSTATSLEFGTTQLRHDLEEISNLLGGMGHQGGPV